MSEGEDYRIVFCAIWCVTRTVAIEILTCEKQPLAVSVYPLHNAIWPLEIILKTWNPLGFHLSRLELPSRDVVTGRRTEGCWILRSAVCCLWYFRSMLCLTDINPLNTELNPIRHLLALVGAHHIVHVSRISVNMMVLSHYLTIYNNRTF